MNMYHAMLHPKRQQNAECCENHKSHGSCYIPHFFLHVSCQVFTLQIFATNVMSSLHTVGGFPDGDDSAVRQRGKKSSIADSEEKVDRNSNSYKHLKFQIKPSDSIQTDFR